MCYCEEIGTDMQQGGLKDSIQSSQNHNQPIPLLIQSVALYIVAFVVSRDYSLVGYCLVTVNDMI